MIVVITPVKVFFENLDFDNTYSSNQYSDVHNLNDIFRPKEDQLFCTQTCEAW